MHISFPTVPRSRWKAILAVAAIATFLRIMLQPLIPAGESQAEPSAIADAGFLIPAFSIYAFVTYTVMSYAFVMFEEGLPWPRMKKGVAFGSMLGLVWIAYLWEPVPLGEGTSLVDSLAYPIVDGLSVLVLGILLGRFVATESTGPPKAWPRGVLGLITVPAAMLAIRLVEYNVIHIYSSYEDRTLETLVWVAVTGFCIGLAYVVLRAGVPSRSPAGRSVAFGVFFYGIPIAFVNFFVVLALTIDIPDMALRSLMDLIAVVVGVFLAEVVPQVVRGTSHDTGN